MAYHHGFEGTPNIVLIGLPNISSLKRACHKLSANGIAHWSWTEPDLDLGFTSICTATISGDERSCLANYRLWKPVYYSPVVSTKTLPSNGNDAGETPAGRASLCAISSVGRAADSNSAERAFEPHMAL